MAEIAKEDAASEAHGAETEKPPHESEDVRPEQEEAAKNPGEPANGGSEAPALAESSGPAPPLSKNQQKRLARQAALQQKKLERKAAKKEQKAAARAERLAAGDAEQPPEKRQKLADGEAPRKPPRIGGRGSHNRERFDAARKQGKKVVIDLSFDDLMSEKEVKSLVIQLGHAYGTNRKSEKPLDLFLTSVEKRAAAGLGKISGFANWRCESRAEHYTEIFPKDKIVYLTSESPNTLQELKEEEAYVIGGIVDHNRLKGLTHSKAEELGLRTARLPLDGNVDLGESRKVLTVNHVFAILLNFHTEGSWAGAFREALPQRKMRGGEEERRADEEGEEEGEEGGEGEEEGGEAENGD